MTTLTEEQAPALTETEIRDLIARERECRDGYCEDYAPCPCDKAAKVLFDRLTNSRPSSGVQPIAGDLGNAGQSEGSAQAAPTTIPPGWKLVPREPTQEMTRTVCEPMDDRGSVVRIWQAMYDAAPTPGEKP